MPQPYIDEMGVTHYNDATGLDVSSLQVTNDENNPVPVTANNLPLPTGAATSANQATANTALSSIDGKIPTLVNGRLPVDVTGSSSSSQGLAYISTYDRILEAFNQRNTSDILSYLGVLKGGNVLSDSSYNILINLLQKTQPDPNYQSQILTSEAELAGFGIILVNEIEELM